MLFHKPRIVYRYIFREIVLPFCLSLFVFTGILFLARVLKLVELVATRDVGFGELLRLFSYILPLFLEITLPMSVFLAVILAFGRLSADSELLVIRASGISLRNLIPPILCFALICVSITIVISFWVRPWANYQLGKGVYEIAKKRASTGLIEGVFNELGSLTIYSAKIDSAGSALQDVIISDQSDAVHPRMFISKNGLLLSDDLERSLVLQLWDGSIHQGSGKDHSVTFFDTNNINLGEDQLGSGDSSPGGKKTAELLIDELNSSLQNLKKKPIPYSTEDEQRIARYQVELHKRIVLPFACIAVTFVGMALGVQPTRDGKAWSPTANMVVGIWLTLAYYVFLAFASALGENNVAPPIVLMWLPNLLFLALGGFLFRKLESEEWMVVSQGFVNLWERMSRLLRITQ